MARLLPTLISVLLALCSLTAVAGSAFPRVVFPADYALAFDAEGIISADAAGSDMLISIENIQGSDFADALTGNDGENWLRGNLGDDTLDGGAGYDWVDYKNVAGAG